MDSYKLKPSFIHPKYWLAWLGIFILFLTSLLPYSTLNRLGKLLGRIAIPFAKSRYDTARRNIELCFPELTPEQIDKKVKANFEHTGIALLEMGMAWFWPAWRVRGLLNIRGLEHLQQASRQDKGIILLGAHFLTLEMGGRAAGLFHPSYAVYRKNSNEVLDYWFYRGRMRENKGMLDRKDFKSMLRVLKTGQTLWYAPDHDYGRHKSSVFAPFFNVEKANTISGTSTLARVKNCVVIPVFLKRLPNNKGYELVFYEALNDFPSNDLILDTTRTNQQIERMIKECDEQYMWLHRRFKTRPEGEPSFYNMQ
ncbi:LpxL/LpxP family Kdo(2)-lipid IV(A) lauroyl/palmitoleoyl acyltransferase [Psychromonas sp. SP041]|uniref:LpxL/LpxP family Kdo(2)-lipid IV(A) lauroyl/palmitoleoyl acyltransferase n=1 Tax=Psychromonas sp. SP041 TaxID=1365007 RepID=UPI0004252B3D|nr:LpxL/LpxP family Kdo(2)-lipid IV(A) lauroyl/palmitoleoyl acyltransferase [Psychromonas sp. SP041]